MEDNRGRTAYIDFSTKIQGHDTEIRILETTTHIFVYVSQSDQTIHLYDDELRKEIVGARVRTHKKLIVFCNIQEHDTFKDVSRMIIDILKK
jgi:hypothetical protein